MHACDFFQPANPSRYRRKSHSINNIGLVMASVQPCMRMHFMHGHAALKRPAATRGFRRPEKSSYQLFNERSERNAH